MKIKVVEDKLGQKKSHIQWETNPRISHEYLNLETFGITFRGNKLGVDHIPFGINRK